MKILLYLTLLGATLLSNVFVFGQGGKPGLEFGQTLPGYIKPPMIFKLLPGKPYMGKPYKREVSVYIGDSVRVMAPDRMPCMVIDLSRMERMPVQRQRNLEPMPNRRQ